MTEEGVSLLRPYPQHPPQSLDALSTKLVDGGMTGVTQELLECRIEQVGYFSILRAIDTRSSVLCLTSLRNRRCLSWRIQGFRNLGHVPV